MTPLGTLYEMLGGAGYSEDSARVYPGLSDATAVPETDTSTDGGWEPAIVINYPVEPERPRRCMSLDVPESVEYSARHTARTAEPELPGTDEPGPPDPTVNLDDRADEAHEFEIESLVQPDTAAPPQERQAQSGPPCRAGTRSCSADPSGRARVRDCVRSQWAESGRLDPVAPRAGIDRGRQPSRFERQQAVRGSDPRAAVQHGVVRTACLGVPRGDLGWCQEAAVGVLHR